MLKWIKANTNKYLGFVLLGLLALIVISKVIAAVIILIALLYLACVFYEVLTF